MGPYLVTRIASLTNLRSGRGAAPQGCRSPSCTWPTWPPCVASLGQTEKSVPTSPVCHRTPHGLFEVRSDAIHVPITLTSCSDILPLRNARCQSSSCFNSLSIIVPNLPLRKPYPKSYPNSYVSSDLSHSVPPLSWQTDFVPE